MSRPITLSEVKDELVKGIIKELPETLRAYEEYWKQLAEQRGQILDRKVNELKEAELKIQDLIGKRDALRNTRHNQDIELGRVNTLKDGYYEEIRNLQALVDNLRKELDDARSGFHESAVYQQGHDDGKTTAQGVINGLKRDIRTLEQKLCGYRDQRERIDKLFQERNEARIEVQALKAQTITLGNDCAEAQELAATVQKNLHQANLELAMKRTVITTLQDRLATFSIHTPNDKQDCVKLAVAGFQIGQGVEQPIQVGDCWVCRVTGDTRCVISADVEDGVKYHHCHKAKPEGYTTKCSFRNFRSLLSESYIGRNVFFPAMYPGEPAAGFRVGDRWVKVKDGGIRIITKVDNTHLTYDFRVNDADQEPSFTTVRRDEGDWASPSMEGAVLHRPTASAPPAFLNEKQITDLRSALDNRIITSDNIGDIRREFFIDGEDAWNSIVRDETAARENIKDYNRIQEGDVWRSPRGCKNVRCVSSVQPLIYLQSNVHMKEPTTQGKVGLSDLREHLQYGEATVTRNAFEPCRYAGEPAAGFMIGDVWRNQKNSEGFRRIVAVSPTQITYDYRTSSTDPEEELHTFNRWSNSRWYDSYSWPNPVLTRQ